MKWFKNLSTAKKIILVVAVIVFLTVSIIKTYFPQVGLSSWTSDINFIASGKPDNAENKYLSVHFIDVGQGDCTLIKTEKCNALIDAGNSINGEDISEYLLSHNVQTLDYLIITHPHSDHYGGATRMIDFIEVKNVMMPEIPEALYADEHDFIYLVNKLNKKNVPFIAVRAGDKYEIGDAVITVLTSAEDGEGLNDKSAVIRLDYGETSFLFMGDAEKDAEQRLLKSNFNLKCDVLKVGHHGSSNGSSESFLEKTNPLIAVISCGYDNEYGHPGEDVLYRINKTTKAAVLRTDINGNIVIGSDGEKLYCTFEKGKRH